MAIFEMQDVDQIYVVKDYKATEEVSDNSGTLYKLKKEDFKGQDMWLKYQGFFTRAITDIMQKNKIKRVSLTRAKDMRTPLKALCMQFDDKAFYSDGSGDLTTYLDSEYIVKLRLRGITTGITDEDEIVLMGDCRGENGMTKAQCIKRMALSLAKNTYYYGAYVRIYVGKKTPDIISGGTMKFVQSEWTEKNIDTKIPDTDIDSIIVKEIKQPWVIGLNPGYGIDFDLDTAKFNADGVDVANWGIVEDCGYSKDELSQAQYSANDEGLIIVSNTEVGYINGQKIADYEYFLIGMRGDKLRQKGFPYNKQTKCMLSNDTDKEYDVLRIEYFWNSEINQEKSSKVLVFVGETGNLDGLFDDLKDMQDELPNCEILGE